MGCAAFSVAGEGGAAPSWPKGQFTPAVFETERKGLGCFTASRPSDMKKARQCQRAFLLGCDLKQFSINLNCSTLPEVKDFYALSDKTCVKLNRKRYRSLGGFLCSLVVLQESGCCVAQRFAVFRHNVADIFERRACVFQGAAGLLTHVVGLDLQRFRD